MLVISAPSSVNISGNLPKIILSATPNEVVEVVLKKGADVILEETYNPDSKGRIEIDYKKIIDPLLVVEVPAFTEGKYLQAKAHSDFTALLTSSLGTNQALNFHVVKSGVAGENVDVNSFLMTNFLTWQPQTKEIKYHDPEFLTYFSRYGSKIFVTGYFNASNPKTVELASLTSMQLATVNLNYGYIANLLSGTPMYYDVVAKFENADLTYTQRYVLTDKIFDHDNVFVFENTAGGIDTIRLTGELEEKNSPVVNEAIFDELTIDFDLSPEKSFTINSGYLLSERHRIWSVEFINSIQKYFLVEGNLNRIVATKPEQTSIKGELASFEIDFVLSKQSKYLNLPRPDQPLPNLQMNTQSGEVFFLAPRLNEFAWSNSNEALIPVQYPYENFFRKISVASLLSELQGISEENDPTVPYWVKSITQADIAKWNQPTQGADLTNYYSKSESKLVFHPLEDQRLSKANNVEFAKIKADTEMVLPSVASAVNNSIWIGTAGSNGGGTNPVVGWLNDLQDVNLSMPAAGQALVFNGTDWVNQSIVTDAYTKSQSDAKYSLIGHTHSYNDLLDKPTIPTNNNQLANGAGYVTAAIINGLATTVYVNSKIADLVASSPEALDTLGELATALGNDPNFATTITTLIGTKANSNDIYTKTVSDARYKAIGWLPTWLEVQNRPTHLSQFANDLGNYGNWITKASADTWYQPLEDQRLSKSSFVEFTKIKAVSELVLPSAQSSANNSIWIGTASGNGSTAPTVTTLASLQDVEFSMLQHGQSIQYDSVTGKWKNVTYQIAGDYALTNGSNASGTWGINITGSAVYFGNQTANFSTSVTSIVNILAQQPGGSLAVANASMVQSYLGLGSFAYKNIVYGGEITTDVAQANLDVGLAKLLRWKNYGDEHVIFDASNGTSPTGSAIDRTNSQQPWTATYPTLMGWNGQYTYGVRVDSARLADSANIWTEYDGTGLGSSIYYTMGYDAGLGKWKPFTATALQTFLGLGASAYTAETLDSVTIRNPNVYREIHIRNGSTINYWDITNSYSGRADMRDQTLHQYVLRASDAAPLPWQENWWDGSKYHAWTTDTTGFIANSKLTAINTGDGSQVYGGALETRGTNAGITFHYPGNYAASLYMNADGLLHWMGNGFYAQGYVNSGRIVAGYDSGVSGSINTSDYLRVSGSGGISWQSYGNYLDVLDASTIRYRGSTNAISIQLANTDGTPRGYVYADASNNVGFLNNSGGWSLRVSNDGYVHANSFNASNWFRSYGDSGWYSVTHGGGVYMNDSTWVRVYNGKSFWCDANIYASGKIESPSIKAISRLNIPTAAPASPQNGDLWIS